MRLKNASVSQNSTGYYPVKCPAALILTVNPLYRGEPIPQDMLSSDLILAADCVYFEPAFPLLVQTLTDLTSMHDPEILFCYKKRRKVLGPLARAFS